MPKRDYVRPSKKKNNVNKVLILTSVVVVLISVGSLLWLLKERSSSSESVIAIKRMKTDGPVSTLPSRPEERYSYIRDLETREISIDDSEKALDKRAQFSEKQKLLLKEKQKNEKELVSIIIDKSNDETDSNISAKRTRADKIKVVGKFGLQCGAFKNYEQAENMKARLLMSGFEARITSRSGWNRIVIGPIGDRGETKEFAMKVKKVADCLVIGM